MIWIKIGGTRTNRRTAGWIRCPDSDDDESSNCRSRSLGPPFLYYPLAEDRSSRPVRRLSERPATRWSATSNRHTPVKCGPNGSCCWARASSRHFPSWPSRWSSSTKRISTGPFICVTGPKWFSSSDICTFHCVICSPSDPPPPHHHRKKPLDER